MNQSQYDAHIDELCKTHNIRRFRCGHDGAPDAPAAHPSERMIALDPLLTNNDYIAALHEIGHVVDPDAFNPIDGEVTILYLQSVGASVRSDHEIAVRDEEAAWAWARNHAREWSLESEAFVARVLESYKKHFRAAPVSRSADDYKIAAFKAAIAGWEQVAIIARRRMNAALRDQRVAA